MDKKINMPGWLKTTLVLLAGILIGWLVFRGGGTSGDTQDTAHAHADSETVWTCSMHPQIRQPEPGKCPLCGMDLIPAGRSGSGGSQNRFVFEMTPEAVALSNVRTVRVRRVDASNELRLTGKIQANEERQGVIASNFSGRVEQLFVSFTGQEVRRGERLATIYSPELITAQQELLEAARTKDINPVLYQAVREKLRLWQVSDAQIRAIESRGQVQANFDVYANTSGIVTARNVSVGDFITRGMPLLEIADLSQVWVLLDAYESDLAWVRKGAQISFTVAALPGQELSAKVAYIDPVINPETRAASVRAETANPNGILKPGMFVNASVTTRLNVASQALAIPSTALLWTGKRSVVYVKVPNAEMPSFELREIMLGSRTGDLYLVESGLEEGDEVVANGVFAIDAAAQLSGNYSMMSLPESKTLEVAAAFQQQLTAVTEEYFKIKHALADDNATRAAQGATTMQQALARVDMGLLQGRAHDEWMKLLTPLRESATKISAEKNIDQQREHFTILSDNILEAVELYGVQKDRVYRAYCPMAGDNTGRFWLSDVPEILNPYYGESMLTCGEIRETYRRGGRVAADAPAQAAPPANAQHNH
jgi:membrane fusion protein, copper/silver efflux system